MRTNSEADFWAKVWKAGDCWRWLGRGKKFMYDGINEHVHRLAWKLSRGPLEKREPIARQCDDPSCINPFHYAHGSSIHPKKIARFWARINKTGPTLRPELGPCWEWNGAIQSDGYGSIAWQGETQLAHRVAWFITHGEISADVWVLHKCDNRKCVRPDHLFTGTWVENNQDKIKKERHRAQLNADTIQRIREEHVLGAKTITLAETYGVGRNAIERILSGRTWKRHTLGRSVYRRNDIPKGSACWHAKLTEDDILPIRRAHENGESQGSIAKRLGVWQGTISSIVLRQTWKHVK